MSDDDWDTGSHKSRSKSGPSLKARAVRLLSMREHTRYELVQKLSPYAENPEQIQSVLNDLESQGWQSDERFVLNFEGSKLERYGARRIAHSMRARGVDESLVQESMARLQTSEEQRALSVWQRRFAKAGLPQDAKEYARQARFLASRGFTAQVVSKILSGRFSPDENDAA